MYRLKVFPYKLGSISAKSLANSLGVKRVRLTYDARRRDVIINWGNSRPANFKSHPNDLNSHSAIALACNKLKTFQELSSRGFENLPDWTTSQYKALDWINEGSKVYCRTNLTGHSGHGIIIASEPEWLAIAPLYTKETKHKYEFRVHVFKGKVLDVQQKKRKRGLGPSGSGIRNHSNGWIYARSDISIPSIITDASIHAVSILGLDFGAVDIGYRERDGKAFVFEVNTAPGLVGTTLTKYTEAFNNYLQELNQ